MSNLRRVPTIAERFRENSPRSKDKDAPTASSEASVSVPGTRGTPARTVPPTISETVLRRGSPTTEALDDEDATQPRLRLASPAPDDLFGDGSVPVPKTSDFPLVLDESQAVAAESFSILRSRLLNVHSRLGIRSVLFTSAETGDGKTLISTNLSLSLGQLGAKRVLLVDGDLRLASASRVFNLKQALGIGDYLHGSATFDQVICKTQISALSVAPAGVAPKKAIPELLQGPRWSEFLDQAKQRFDLIVVDALPISAPVVDLELLAEPCDAVLLVVRMRRTNRQTLKRSTSRIDAKKFLGVIINNADEIYDYDYGYVNQK